MASFDIDPSQSLVNLLRNGSFEGWSGGLPRYWSLSGSGASVAKNTTTPFGDLAALDLTRNGTDAVLTQNIIGNTVDVSQLRGKFLTLSGWVKAGGKAQIGLNDGTQQVWSRYAANPGQYVLVTVTLRVSDSADRLYVSCRVSETNGTSSFDALMLTIGKRVAAFSPNPADQSDPLNSDVNAPLIPTGFTASATVLAIQVSWDASTEADIDHYELQRADDSGFTTNVVSWNVYTTTFIDKTDTAVVYHYRLRAIRWSGATSAWTLTVLAGGSLINTQNVSPDAWTTILQTTDMSAMEIAGNAGTVGDGQVIGEVFSPTGGAVLCVAMLRLQEADPAPIGVTDYWVSIQRDSTVLWSRDGNLGPGEWHSHTWTYLDAPPSGSYTYNVRAGGQNPLGHWTLQASKRLIQCVELKR